MDICAYGYEYDKKLSITLSSGTAEQSDLENFPVQTKVEHEPWIILDLKGVVSLTAIDLELIQFKEAEDIYLLTSVDGETWKDWGVVSSAVMQLEVTRYEAGAWVPGHDVRYIKLMSKATQALELGIKKFSCFSHSNIN